DVAGVEIDGPVLRGIRVLRGGQVYNVGGAVYGALAIPLDLEPTHPLCTEVEGLLDVLGTVLTDLDHDAGCIVVEDERDECTGAVGEILVEFALVGVGDLDLRREDVGLGCARRDADDKKAGRQ